MKYGWLSLPVCLLAAVGADVCGAEVDFNRDIRPILSNHCFQCHGPDEETRAADLRLDKRRDAVADRDGAAAIVVGRAADSVLMQRVTADDVDIRMPPADFGKPLTAQQIDLLKAWIDGGAEYAKHWSFEPVRRPDVPDTDSSGHNEIDRFVRARLSEHNLTPAPQADRYTLIRRVYLDLLGLPPEIAEVDRFITDKGKNAYDAMLDRVLSSPHFGERWGRHWLDQARYADSHGYTVDNDRSMWPYRDWVIDAFNRDLPFDQFTIEQLAGDLLDQPTLSQQIATGFHRNTLINTEGGTKDDQFRDEQVKDRVDTTGLVWMGLTIGCAKCHTHKFDPITQHEYYQFYAFFNSTADNNSVSPTVRVPTAQQKHQVAKLEAELRALAAQINADQGRADRQRQWQQDIITQADRAVAAQNQPDHGWIVLNLSGQSRNGSELSVLDDQSLLVSGPKGITDDFYVTASGEDMTVRSVRLEVLTHDSLPKNGPGRAGNGNFVLSEFEFQLGEGQQLRFANAAAEHSQPRFPVAHSIDGRTDTGWAINGAPEGSMNRNRTAWYVLSKPATVQNGQPLVFHLKFANKDYSIGRFRISVSDQQWQDRAKVKSLAKLIRMPKQDRSAKQQAELDDAFLQQDTVLRPARDLQIKTAKKLDRLQRTIPTTMVLKELDKPRPTYLQVRGDFLRTGDQVHSEVPAVLPQMHSGADRLNRLDLARWLVHPDHPLTARVRVNRIWMRLFGRGLVETENDFGMQGTLPSHPELLDWLADEFQRRDWSTKSLLKLIMTSATYRQSSVVRPELTSVDSRNLLLARQNRIRVEAEIVRDLALSVSGRLSESVGGPGVYPPQESGVYAFTQTKKNWKTSTGDDRFRRGLYTYFYRSAPYPMLETFDVPKFNTTCTRRDRSNTPLQSLTMANSQAMYELAELFGDRLLKKVPGNADLDRLRYGFRLCFARHPGDAETETLERYLQQSRDRFSDEQQAWTAVARLLLNLDEFITRE